MRWFKKIPPLILLTILIYSNNATLAEEIEQDVALWKVPNYIISAAKRKMPGIRILQLNELMLKTGK